MGKIKIGATRIYNVDEIGLSRVPNKCQKVLSEKGKRSVGSLSTGEKGVNTIVVCFCTAAGLHVSPTFNSLYSNQQVIAI